MATPAATGAAQPTRKTGTLHSAVTKEQLNQAFYAMWNAPTDEKFLELYYHDFQPARQAYQRQQAAGQGAH